MPDPTIPPPPGYSPVESGAIPPPPPGYKPVEASGAPGFLSTTGNALRDFGEGVGAGVASTGVGVYNLARKIPGADKVLPPVSPTIEAATHPPDYSGLGWPGKAGKMTEQVGEFMLPAGEIAKGAKAIEGATAGMRAAPALNAAGKATLEAGSAAGVTAAQTGGDTTAMRNAALTAGAVSGGISALGAAAPSASRIYQSALKTALGGQKGRRVGQIVETGLREEIPASRAGLETAGDRIDDINRQIESGIQARQAAGLKVDLQSVLKRLDDLKARAQYMDDPQGQLDAINSIEQKFLQGHGTFDPQTGALISSEIPIDKAQKMKQVIGTDIRKSYGEMKSYEVEAKKQLVRGLKEEIESVFPEVKALNQREGSLIDLEGSLQKFVNREGNHQLISPFTLMLGAGAMGAGEAMHPGAGAGAGVMTTLLRMALENPEIKSRIAIAARKGSQAGIPGAASSVAPKITAPFAVNRDQPQPQFARGGIVTPKKPRFHRSRRGVLYGPKSMMPPEPAGAKRKPMPPEPR